MSTTKLPLKDTKFLLRCVEAALAEAREAHPQPFVDGHHALGILMEEVREVEIETYKRRPNTARLQAEWLQIAAVALRAIEDVTLKEGK